MEWLPFRDSLDTALTTMALASERRYSLLAWNSKIKWIAMRNSRVTAGVVGRMGKSGQIISVPPQPVRLLP
jgi:hypothetical protein